MRIADFIRSHHEPILEDWDSFARNFGKGHGMSKAELRDHAREMLLAIANDIESSQTDSEQEEKSKGTSDSSDKKTWAKVHGSARQQSGFDVNETVSEFRALRASVLSHWGAAKTGFSPEAAYDITRFNESIDEAVAESMAQYAADKEMQSRTLTAVLVASPDPIAVLDLEGKFTYANQAAADMFGLPLQSIVGSNPMELGFPFAWELLENQQHVIAQLSRCRGELTHRCSMGEVRRFEYDLAPILDEMGNCEATVCMARDITERAGAEEESRYNAYHDDLTGLPNRRLFLDRLDQEFKHAKRAKSPLAVLYIDLDGFKEINDSMGHQAGDLLLNAVAGRLTDCVREDDSVARLGGDEFTILLSGATQLRDIKIVAQSIINKLEVPFDIDGKSLRISASIGGAMIPDHALTSDGLLRAADKAMYIAKNFPGSRFYLSGDSIQGGRAPH